MKKTSSLTRPVGLVCMLQSPQSVGYSLGLGHDGVAQTAIIAEGPLLHLEVEAGLGVDVVAKLAMLGSGQRFSMTTLPASSKILASISCVHSHGKATGWFWAAPS